MFVAALLIKVIIGNQPSCPSTNECVKNMCCIYAVEYYSNIKKNEIMSFSGKWTELEIMILSKISQVKKDKYCMFSFICGILTLRI
jgi:hypothetical protein